MVPSASTIGSLRPKLLFGHRSFDWTIEGHSGRLSIVKPFPPQSLSSGFFDRFSPAEQLIKQSLVLFLVPDIDVQLGPHRRVSISASEAPDEGDTASARWKVHPGGLLWFGRLAPAGVRFVEAGRNSAQKSTQAC